MAVKWAVANGNWNSGTTWNDGVVPAVGDDVYINNHYVTVNSNVNIGSGHISNDVNPNTGIAGGVILYTATCTITANIVCRYAKMFTQYAQSVSITIIGNIVGIGGADEDIFLSEYGLSTTIRVNGNVDAGVMNIFNKISPSPNITYFVINGNVAARTLVKTAISFSLIVNGNAEVLRIKSVATNSHVGNIAITNLHMSSNDNVADISVGSLKCTNCTLVATNLSVGKIEYTSTTNSVGVRYTTLNILNPDTFTWKDVTEPRSNPFIILTDAEMNNRQQYPPENEVKQGTEYVWGEKVGTYQQPPESVVLKDFVYDNGERTGTLENEVTVNVGCTDPQDVRKDIPLANMGIVGTMVIPSPENVLEGTIYDNGTEGTLESQSTADYPAEDKVLIGTSYDHDNKIGTLEPGGDNPQESDVRFGVSYNYNLNTGKAHIPSSQDVRKNIPVEDTVGQIVIPRASEVKKDVEFDIDSVGTMESVVETNNTINVYRKNSSI